MKPPIDAEQQLSAQGVYGFLARLTQALSCRPRTDIAKDCHLSRSTISLYHAQERYPDLIKLATIANVTGFSLHWLLYGHDNQQHPTLFTLTDDVMSPSIKNHSQVMVRPIRPSLRYPYPDGLYLISDLQGQYIRRLQWREESQHYCVFGDNPAYPPHLKKSVDVLGVVTAVLTPI
ncbi:helix-turn-helix domain-containing protein [Photobacterium damselae]|uniref:helix-turn-helix domain-containing protein n=1 Tax=Photobacterium damselae TaxID=38293 RepID=UPI004069063F